MLLVSQIVTELSISILGQNLNYDLERYIRLIYLELGGTILKTTADRKKSHLLVPKGITSFVCLSLGVG